MGMGIGMVGPVGTEELRKENFEEALRKTSKGSAWMPEVRIVRREEWKEGLVSL
jgi:hypothetical protein